jgi:hypothetical protein
LFIIQIGIPTEGPTPGLQIDPGKMIENSQNSQSEPIQMIGMGAAIGSAFGPIGTAIGGAVGGFLCIFVCKHGKVFSISYFYAP